MRPGQARFVTVCQQLLVLGAVLAALTPAAGVISLDVVSRAPAGHASAVGHGPAVRTVATVPTAPVDPVVREYALTAPAGARVAPGALRATSRPMPGGGIQLLGRPEPVSGYGAVGVSWAHGEDVDPAALTVQVRTRTGDTWSGWTALDYDPEHGPDPRSEEAERARPGTDPLLVGRVDDVQVRVEAAAGAAPADLKLAVIDPGAATDSRREVAAIDTATLHAPDDTPSDATPGVPEDTAVKATSDGTVALQASTYTPKPQIFSRAQWGADESLREASSLHYYEVHAGFVHHTVNANDYTRAQVPALIRGIYAYHVKVRGWSDIGYNFLVDRFGRIWEGRYGGVDRPVVGAHTLGYNDYSFAMSAIGNYELVKPSDRVLQAYGRLFAWKLSLHGVDPASTRQLVGDTWFEAINGHRDAASTACPGRYLYARLDTIRDYAAADQTGWTGRERATDLASTPNPDLVVRRAADGRAFVIPTGGITRFESAAAISAVTAADTEAVVATPDVTGDGHGDLVVRDTAGVTRVLPGDGAGGFAAPVRPTTAFRGKDRITATGDLDGDGHADLAARNPATGRLNVYLGNGRGGFTREVAGGGWGTYRLIAGAGDADGDGHADLVVKDAEGRLWLRPGAGDGTFRAAVSIPGDFGDVNALTGLGDFNQDGRSDLFVRYAATKAGVVLPGRGDGGYGHPLGNVIRVSGLASLSAADLTGTAQPDLVGRRGGSFVLIEHAGTFDAGSPIDTGMNLAKANTILNVGDWDRDGFGDVIARSRLNGNLYLHRGDGTGRFGPSIRVGAGFGSVRLLAAVGDMTGDGFPDLMGQPVGAAMRIYPGAGLDGLRPSYVAYSGIDANRQIGVGRWNTDGAPDSLLRKGSTLRLFPGNGPGGLTSGVTTFGIDLTPYDWVLGIGDENLTGHADVVVRERATGYLWLLPGTDTGFGDRVFLGEGMGVYDLAG